MNNSNSRPFTQRGRALLDELKEFTVQINSSVANKQEQLAQIIRELKLIENKIITIKNDFLTKRNNILGQEFAIAPTPFPTIMKMDAFLYDLKDQKNKENARRKQEANKLVENQRLLTEATGKNITEKTQIIRNTINKLRRNIGNTNNSSNNNYKPPNIFNNVRPNNGRPNNGRPNNVRPNNGRPNNVRPNNGRPNNLVSHPLNPNMRALQTQLRTKLANRRAAIANNNNNVSPPPNKQNIFANETKNQRANRLKKFNNAKKALSAQLQPRPPL